MSLRRVQLDDDADVAYTEPGEPVPLDADGDALADLQKEDAELEEGEAADAERRERGERDEMRTRDLARVPTVLRPTSRKPPTADQLRVREEWKKVTPRPDQAFAAAFTLLEGQEIKGEGPGVVVDREGAKCIGREMWSDPESKPASEWLRDHDPLTTAKGVEAGVHEQSVRHGLTLDDCRRAFRRGRPSASHRVHREQVRLVLAPMWEAGVRRTLLAEALGCSEPALYGLMGGAT